MGTPNQRMSLPIRNDKRVGARAARGLSASDGPGGDAGPDTEDGDLPDDGSGDRRMEQPTLEALRTADFIEMPPWIDGTNCANCRYEQYNLCQYNGKVDLRDLPVSIHTCCAFWDADAVTRPWKKLPIGVPQSTISNQAGGLLVVNSLNGLRPGQKFEVVELADGRQAYNLIDNEHNIRLVNNDGTGEQTAPAKKLGDGAGTLNDVSTPARAHAGATSGAANKPEEPTANTWSDAAREAAEEALRARAHVKDRWENSALSNFTEKASQASAMAGHSNTPEAHEAAWEAHKSAAEAYRRFGPKNLQGETLGAEGHNAAGQEHLVAATHLRRMMPGVGVTRNAEKIVKPVKQPAAGSAEAGGDIAAHLQRVAPPPKTPESAVENEDKDLTSEKAKQILRDGTAQGHPLTPAQKRYFGWIAGGTNNQTEPEAKPNPDEGQTMNQLTTNQSQILAAFEARWPFEARAQYAVTNAQDFAGPEGTFPIANRKDFEDVCLLASALNSPADITVNAMQIAQRKGFLVDNAKKAPVAPAAGMAPTTDGAPGAAPGGTGPQWSPLHKEPENMSDQELHGHAGRVASEIARRSGPAAPLPPDAPGATAEGYQFPGTGSEVSNDMDIHSFDNGKPVQGGSAQVGGAGKKEEYPPDKDMPMSEQHDADRGARATANQNPGQFNFPAAQPVQQVPVQRPVGNQAATLNSLVGKLQKAQALGLDPLEAQILANAVNAYARKEVDDKFKLVSRMVANVQDANERNRQGNWLMGKSLTEIENLAGLMSVQQPIVNQQPQANFLSYGNFGSQQIPQPVYLGATPPGGPAPTGNANQEIEVQGESMPLFNSQQHLYGPGGDGFGASQRLLDRLGRNGTGRS